jgi:PKHD-type hydroxylase
MPDWAGFGYFTQRNGLFSAVECAEIVGYQSLAAEVEAKIVTDELVRDSSLFWLFPNFHTQWLFDRVAAAINEWNEAYGFEINPPESFQLTRYTAGQHYNWHMDLGYGPMSRRKISFVMGLNDGFTGGGLEIFFGKAENPVLRLAPGDCAIFPSFIMHRALPIDSGERWSLVSWVLGPEPIR